MEYILLLVLICAVIVAYILIRRQKERRPPVDVYVCSECGLKHCVCHKENHDDAKKR